MKPAHTVPRCVVFKITFPNGKIYVGSDIAYTMHYYGTPSAKPEIVADHTWEQQCDFSIRKEILWFAEDAPQPEVLRIENEWIVKLRSNDPLVGYNKRPKPQSVTSRGERTAPAR